MLRWHSLLVCTFALTFWDIGILNSAADTYCEIAGTPCDDYTGYSESGLNEKILSRLERWRNANSRLINHRYITLFDVSQHSAIPRFSVIDIEAKEITTYLAAHGKGSDPDHDGVATIFSDTPGSKATPLGFFLTAETYVGKHGLSLRLDGLEDRNKNARARSIVIHGADYIDQSRVRLGRSWGCPALSHSEVVTVIDQIKGGSILYIHEGPKP